MLLAITIFLTIFSIYYYIRVVKSIVFEDPVLIYNNVPAYCFKNNGNENMFLLVSSFLLLTGPIFIYIFFNKISTFFINLQCLCQLDIFSFIIV